MRTFAALFLAVGCEPGVPPVDSGDPGDSADSGDAGGSIPGVGGPTVLDPTCGGTGRVVLALGVGDSADHARAVHREADGITAIVGTVDEPVLSQQAAWIAAVHLRDDCTLDPAYGAAGLATFTVADPPEQVEDVHRVRFEPDGAITVFGPSVQPLVRADGSIEHHPALTAARFVPEGAFDAAFGVPFLHLFRVPDAPYPDEHAVRGIVTLPDGAIRVLTQTGGPYDAFALSTLAGSAFDPAATTIYAAEGEVDGLVYGADRVEGLAILDDGSLRIGGVFVDGTTVPSLVPGLLKLDPTGAVDPAYGIRGVAGLDTAGGDVESVTSVAETPDGYLLLASVVAEGGDGYEALGVIRIARDGTVDRTFGVGGVARVALAAGVRAHALGGFAVNPDGTMVIGGSSYAADGSDDRRIGAARFLADGTLDPTFADGGVFDAGALSAGAPEELNGVDQASDGVVTLVATRTTSPSDSDWVVYRLAPAR
ncbi:MAG: delta-60 repeat domain-containing protein [Myxococcota bacterium]